MDFQLQGGEEEGGEGGSVTIERAGRAIGGARREASRELAANCAQEGPCLQRAIVWLAANCAREGPIAVASPAALHLPPPLTPPFSLPQFLFQLQLDGVIKNFSEHHTTDTVKFVIGVKARSMKGLMKNRNKTFRLETRISTSNMNAFNVDGEIVKYESPADIIDEFFEVRLELYGKRKEDMERKMEHAVKLVENKARFIEAVVGGDVNLLGGELRKEEVVTLLDSLGFDRKGSLDKMLGSEEEAEGDKGGFEYLLSTPVGGFTRDKIEALRREKGEKVASLEALRGQSKEQMWLDDLDELEKVL